jgi:hypothetical protein
MDLVLDSSLDNADEEKSSELLKWRTKGLVL